MTAALLHLDLIHHSITAVLQAVAAPAPHPAGAPTPPAYGTNLGGCTDSPEAATIVLMAVGLIGLFYGSTLARKFRERKAATN